MINIANMMNTNLLTNFFTSFYQIVKELVLAINTQMNKSTHSS